MVGYPFTWPNDWSRCNVIFFFRFYAVVEMPRAVSDCSFSAQCFVFPAPNSLVQYIPNKTIVIGLIFVILDFLTGRTRQFFKFDLYFRKPGLSLSLFSFNNAVIQVFDSSAFFHFNAFWSVVFIVDQMFLGYQLNFSELPGFEFLLLGQTTIIGRNVGDIYLKNFNCKAWQGDQSRESCLHKKTRAPRS